MCILGPKAPISIPAIICPPARPTFKGALIPGMKNGIEPKSSPTSIPMEMDTRLGSRSSLTVFPRSSPTFVIPSEGPTVTSLSPVLRMVSGLANIMTPERDTLVMFTPKRFLKSRDAIVRPLTEGLVTRIQCETMFLSKAFQSIPLRFQSVSSFCPNMRVMSAASFCDVVTSSLSPSSMTVSGPGITTFPSLHSLDTTKWSFVIDTT